MAKFYLSAKDNSFTLSSEGNTVTGIFLYDGFRFFEAVFNGVAYKPNYDFKGWKLKDGSEAAQDFPDFLDWVQAAREAMESKNLLLPRFPQLTIQATEEPENDFSGVGVHRLEDDFAPLAGMEPGYYRIAETGDEFEIEGPGEFFNYKRILIPSFTGNGHILNDYSWEYWGAYYALNPEEDTGEYYEPDCSACGDGGCIHCEPHRFVDFPISY